MKKTSYKITTVCARKGSEWYLHTSRNHDEATFEINVKNVTLIWISNGINLIQI